jgi:hypothetical protein
VTKKNFFMAGALLVIMIWLTAVVLAWHTNLDESHSIFGIVCTACVTPCLGDLHSKNFFILSEKTSFGKGEIVDVTTYLDPTEVENLFMDLQIVGATYGEIKFTTEFGPASTHHEREFFAAKADTSTFNNPTEDHIFNIYIKVVNEDVNNGEEETEMNHTPELSFTMAAIVMVPFSKLSVIVAAVLMIMVYLFILLEVIHRTLIAIFGSMVALFFLFLMHDGYTESISVIMQVIHDNVQCTWAGCGGNSIISCMATDTDTMSHLFCILPTPPTPGST